MFVCIVIYGSIVFFFLIFCCRILFNSKSKKCIERKESVNKFYIISFSEISVLVCVDEESKVLKINEGYVVDIFGDDNVIGLKIFLDVDRK